MKYQKNKKTKHKETSFYEKATKYALSFKRYTEAAIGLVFLTGTLSYACWKGINFYSSYKQPANGIVQSTATANSDSPKLLDEYMISEIKRTNNLNEKLLEIVLNERNPEKSETMAKNETVYAVSASTESKIEKTVQAEQASTKKKCPFNLGDMNLRLENGQIKGGDIKLDEEKLKWVYENALKPAYKYTLKPAYNYTLKPIIGLFKKKAKEDTDAKEAKPSIEKILEDSPEKQHIDDRVTDFSSGAA